MSGVPMVTVQPEGGAQIAVQPQMTATDGSRGNTYSASGGATLNIHTGAVFQWGNVSESAKPPPLDRCPAPSERHGGSGKTQTGLSFVDKYFYKPGQQRFSQVYWIDATNAETIVKSLVNIAQSAGIGSTADRALNWLALPAIENINWLMFFDNADDPELDLTPYFPNCSHGSILITTRNRRAARYCPSPESDYNVGEMAPDEAEELLIKHARLFNPSPAVKRDVAELVKELYYFPLPVSQAGAYIDTVPYTPREYIRLLRDCQHRPLHEDYELKGRDKYAHRSIAATLPISYAKLTRQARELLGLFSALYHDGIREDIFKNMHAYLHEFAQRYAELMKEEEKNAVSYLKMFCIGLSTDGHWDPAKIRKLTNELESYFFASFTLDPPTCSIHPLVHEWTHNSRDPSEQIALRQRALILLGSSATGFRGKTAEERVLLSGLAPHVDKALDNLDLVYNGCQDRFGYVYESVRRWGDAERHRKRYKEACEQVLGEEDPRILVALSSLGQTYYNQKRLKDAEGLQLQALEGQKRRLEPDYLDTLLTAAGLAATYWDQQRFAEAQKLFLQVVEGRKKHLGAEDFETLISMRSLASTYKRQGRFQEAEKLNIQVVEGCTRQLGADHLDTLSSMLNLASTYRHQKRYGDAEKLEVRIVNERTNQLGADHLDTLESMHNLAITYKRQQRFGDAERLEKRVVEGLAKQLGIRHLGTLLSMLNLVITYQYQNRYDDAAKVGELVVHGRTNQLGADHLETLDSMHSLAITYKAQRRYSDAKRLEAQVLEGRTKQLGADHLDTLDSMYALASIYRRQQRLDDAEKLEIQIVKGRTKHLGADHLETLNSMQNLATTHIGQQRYDDAERLDAQILQGRMKQLGADHLSTLNSMYRLAWVLKEQDKLSEAEDLAQRMVSIYEQHWGADHSGTQGATELLREIKRLKQNCLVQSMEPTTKAERNLASQGGDTLLSPSALLILGSGIVLVAFVATWQWWRK